MMYDPKKDPVRIKVSDKDPNATDFLREDYKVNGPEGSHLYDAWLSPQQRHMISMVGTDDDPNRLLFMVKVEPRQSTHDPDGMAAFFLRLDSEECIRLSKALDKFINREID